MPQSPAPFPLTGPLPAGTTLLQASAGTGKTYTIAALVARYVAEAGIPLSELLVVTFGRAATRELRERVRLRLATARDALSDPVNARSDADPVVAHLAAADAATVKLRQARLAQASSDFDAATIATTHGFCQMVIRGLGTAVDADPDTDLIEDLTDLRAEAAADLYVRKYAPVDQRPGFDFGTARVVAREATTDPHARLEPTQAEGPAGDRARFAVALRTQVGLRLRDRRAMGFDDLLVVLRDALRGPAGQAVRDRLAARYRVVLVDEFQDTDPVQWQILADAFADRAILVLIGDPKQAIYAFRGGDVQTYLAAAATCDHQATLPCNFRSDQYVLRGLDALFAGAALGDDRIRVEPVTAGAPEPRLRSATDGSAAVRLRIQPVDSLPRNRKGLALAGPVRAAIATDLAAQIVGDLDGGSTLTDGPGTPARPVSPGDIAVLVRRNSDGERVRDRLAAAGIPTVLRATSSVFSTAAATDWLVLLEALDQPHRIGRVRRLAVSGLVGLDAAGVEAGGEGAHDRLAQQGRIWSRVLAERGPAALLAAVDADHGTFARLLAQVGGERRATDLRHIADVLHTAAVADRMGLTALLTWLRRRITEAEREPGAERSRRLDSDAQAVQVVSIHNSKGLEFPIVYVPFAWARYVPDDAEVALFHDAEGARVRDVGGPGGPAWAAALSRARAEEAGEELRLLYVAATRARSRLTLWWARSTITAAAPLHRLLFAPPEGPSAPSYDVPADDAAAETHLRARTAGSGGALRVDVVTDAHPTPTWSAPSPPAGEPTVRRFRRELDTAWRRTSYSSLTAAAHAAGATSEPERLGTADEPEDAVLTADPEPAADQAPPVSPFGNLPGGTSFGTLVHEVLERVDPGAGPVVDQLRTEVGAALQRAALPGIDPEELTTALHVAMSTPLGPLAEDRCLADFGVRDRLCELDFELPLAGGDRPTGQRRLAELAALLRQHLQPDDPIHAYAARLEEPDLAPAILRGYLTGSIDAVLRTGRGSSARHLVVDYKTNRLHPAGEPGTAAHYRPALLAPAMRASDYPLQALLYQVALHRYLRWRQPDYDPARHLGGVLYLYLRGMCGPTGAGPDGMAGVFSWNPPAALVVATSELLA